MTVNGNLITNGTATNQNGLNITAAEIQEDGTLGGRFTTANGWATQNGKLPGFGAARDMPDYIRKDDAPRIVYKLAVSKVPDSAGTLRISPDQTWHDPGSTVTVKAVPASGYRFIGWSGAVASSDSIVTITMNDNLDLTANFERRPTIAITTQPAEELFLVITQGSTTDSLTVSATVSNGETPSYQWYDLERGPIAGATNASFAIPTDLSPGVYSYYYFCLVTATDAAKVTSNGTRVLIAIVEDSSPIRLPQIASANSIVPTQNALSLQAQTAAQVQIYSLAGKLQKTLNFSPGVYNIPMANLPKGMYIVKTSFHSVNSVNSGHSGSDNILRMVVK
jgi:hypothetical protein